MNGWEGQDPVLVLLFEWIGLGWDHLIDGRVYWLFGFWGFEECVLWDWN